MADEAYPCIPLPDDPDERSWVLELDSRDFRTDLEMQMGMEVLDVPVEMVDQVRVTRWGHAIPIAEPGRIVDGTTEDLRRPFEGRVYFVNQDNWLLPAVENSLLDARTFTDQIAAQLG